MKINNPDVAKKIDSGERIKINLGCGAHPKPGYVSLDHANLPGIDVTADLNAPLDLFPDNSVDAIYTRHVLEHVDELLPLLKEMHRITCKDGVIEVIVPHFSNPYYYSDPTHVNFFGLYTMFYFVDPEDQPTLRKVPAFYSDVRFKIDRISIEFYRNNLIDRVIGSVLKRLLKKNLYLQDLYERRFCRLYPASQIRYLMRPVK